MCTYSGSELEGSEKFFLQEPDLTDVHLSWCYGCTSILCEESLLCAQLRADEAEASNLERLNPSENRTELDRIKSSKIGPFDFIRSNSVAFAKWHTFLDFIRCQIE